MITLNFPDIISKYRSVTTFVIVNKSSRARGSNLVTTIKPKTIHSIRTIAMFLLYTLQNITASKMRVIIVLTLTIFNSVNIVCYILSLFNDLEPGGNYVYQVI
jgi:hypothetical protein